MSVAKMVKIVLTGLILWLLMPNSQLNLGLFSSIYQNPLSTLAVMGICGIMVILHTWRWYRLNEVQGINLSFKHTIMPTYIGIGFNAVLPGSVGGDFVRLYFILKEFPKKKSAAILSILVDRINGLMGIILIACLTAPYYFETYRNNDALFYILVTCFGVCLSGAAAFFICTSLLAKNSAFSKKLMHRLSSTRFAETASSLIEAIHVYRHAKLIILESLTVSIMTQLLLLLVVTIIGKMMGLPPVSPFDYMIALVIGQIANLIPLTPGGIGVGEAAFANILMLLNPGTTAAYATAFLALRLISTATYLPGVFIGIFGFHLLRSKKIHSLEAASTA